MLVGLLLAMAGFVTVTLWTVLRVGAQRDRDDEAQDDGPPPPEPPPEPRSPRRRSPAGRGAGPRSALGSTPRVRVRLPVRS